MQNWTKNHKQVVQTLQRTPEPWQFPLYNTAIFEHNESTYKAAPV